MNHVYQEIYRLHERDRFPHGALFLQREYENLMRLSFGGPGVGKTNFANVNLHVAVTEIISGADSDLVLIIVDRKNVYYQKLRAYLPKEAIWLINPYDTRSVVPDFNSLLLTPGEFRSIFKYFIPEKASKEQVFPLFAQEIGIEVGACLLEVRKNTGRRITLRDICLCSSPLHIEKLFQRYNRQEGLNLIAGYKAAGKERNDFYRTLVGYMRQWNTIAALVEARPAVPFKNCLQRGPVKAIIIGGDDREPELSESFAGLVFEGLYKEILSLPQCDTLKVLIANDELSETRGELVKHLASLAGLNRSYGVGSMLATQSVKAIEEKLGQPLAHKIISVASHLAFFNMDFQSAHYISHFFGECEYLYYNESESWNLNPQGQTTYGGSANYSYQRRPRILPQDLMSLPLASPKTGITGIFYQSGLTSSGIPDIEEFTLHQWHYSPEFINRYSLRTDKSIPAFERIPDTSDDYALKPYTEDELRQLGIYDEGKTDEESGKRKGVAPKRSAGEGDKQSPTRKPPTVSQWGL